MPKSNPPDKTSITIGSRETAEMLGISRQTLYNYLATNSPRAPRPMEEVRGEDGKRVKLIWNLRDVITHVEARSSGVAYVGVAKSHSGWVPTVTFHGRRWDGQTRDTIHDAFTAAREYYERNKRR